MIPQVDTETERGLFHSQSWTTHRQSILFTRKKKSQGAWKKPVLKGQEEVTVEGAGQEQEISLFLSELTKAYQFWIRVTKSRVECGGFTQPTILCDLSL